MRFSTWVRQTRQAKRRDDPTAYTQEACGSRMNPPITQSAWSQLENDSSDRPEYDTVIRVADALRVSREEALKVAGYDVRKQLRIQEAVEYINGEERPAELSAEQRAKLIQAAEKARDFLDSIEDILQTK